MGNIVFVIHRPTKQVLAAGLRTFITGEGGASGVVSFNSRTGAVTLSGSDVTTALGYSPANNASLALVALSGSYADLSGKPAIPSTAAEVGAATVAQGAKADSAVQPGSLASVATSGSYNDLAGKPALGTAAATSSTAYATAEQGTKADSAVQPGALADVATSGSYGSLLGLPTIPTTAAQVGAIAASEKGAASGVATLDGGSKIPLAQLPATAITDTSVIASQAAMLALTAQTGDVAIRTDINTSFILVAEPANTLGNWQQLLSPGGGGAVGLRQYPAASVPAAGAAGGGVLVTDKGLLLYDNGAAYSAYGPIDRLYSPPITGWSWVNQGAAAVVSSGFDQVISGGGSGTGASIRGRFRAIPGGAYTLTACLQITMLAKTFQSGGIALRDSVSGKIIVCALLSGASGTQNIQYAKFNSPTSFYADYIAPSVSVGGKIWLRIVDNGTNRITLFSVDGINFLEIYTVERTNFITPNEIGFVMSTENSATPNLAPIVRLVSWQVA